MRSSRKNSAKNVQDTETKASSVCVYGQSQSSFAPAWYFAERMTVLRYQTNFKKINGNFTADKKVRSFLLTKRNWYDIIMISTRKEYFNGEK